MKIERKQLINDLYDFASRGDGVVIGGPGVGKSYILKELRQHLRSAGNKTSTLADRSTWRRF